MTAGFSENNFVDGIFLDNGIKEQFIFRFLLTCSVHSNSPEFKDFQLSTFLLPRGKLFWSEI